VCYQPTSCEQFREVRLQPNERALIDQQLAKRVPLPQQAAE
jgi:hypothetical protein